MNKWLKYLLALTFFTLPVALILAAPEAVPGATKSVSVVPVPAKTATPSKVMYVSVSIGKSKLLKLKDSVSRVAVGDPNTADFKSISPGELLVLGKGIGSTNIILWYDNGESALVEVVVSPDLGQLVESLRTQLPLEKDIHVNSASGSVVLGGSVSNTIAAESAVSLSEAYVRNMNRYSGGAAAGGGGALMQVINLMKIRDPQQVMLDVKVAEISKSLLDQLGINLTGGGGGDPSWSIVSNFATSGAAGLASIISGANNSLTATAEKDDSLVKILAQPTLVAISGQEGSFLVGGEVFIPVTQSTGGTAGSTVTLQDRQFGVGLKFIPTVLDNGRISLKVAPEVSDIGQPLTLQSGGTTSILPTFTIRRVSTTVQLQNGQSLVIGGLLKNNITEAVKAFPFLGEIPILGALFRSTQFTSQKTELVIVISATLVKPTSQSPVLPTDKFTPPDRNEYLFKGKFEGQK